MNAPIKQSSPTAEPEKKYTRAQLRAAERVKQEADQLHRQLCGRFVHFFMNSENPEGIEVLDKAKELSEKWKMYCHREHIKQEFHNSISDFCKKYLEDYKVTKANETVHVNS
jgi:hypothetical protein